MLIVRYEFKLYEQNKIDGRLIQKIIEQKNKEMYKEKRFLNKCGVCPRHHIYMNAYHKCDLCGD